MGPAPKAKMYKDVDIAAEHMEIPSLKEPMMPSDVESIFPDGSEFASQSPDELLKKARLIYLFRR